MLPTLAERLREQQAKSRARRPSHPPWPVPGEPPTALLFQARPGLERATVHAVVITEIVMPEPLAAVVAEPAAAVATVMSVPPRQVPERTLLAELMLLLVWAVLVVIDGALALASLIDGAAGRQRPPQVRAASALSPSSLPPFLMAVAAP